MLMELGPIPAQDVTQWARFARRMLCEFSADPGDLEGVVTTDLLDAWQTLIDTWDSQAVDSTDPFRWTSEMDVELSEFLLHGVDRVLHSDLLRERSTREEKVRHAPFTFHVVQAFVDGLAAEGRCHEHYVDQVRASVGAHLDH